MSGDDAQDPPEVDAAELAAILAAAVDGIVVIDGPGRILELNAAAERMFGYTRAEVIGQSVTMLMPEPYRSGHADRLERYLTTREAHVIGIGREVEGLRRDGHVFPLWLSLGEADTIRGVRFVGILRDLSVQRAAEREQVDLEARLAHASRFSVMAEMAAGIAHEINQPLSAIATYAQAGRRMLAGGQWTEEELDDLCARIAEQGQRAGQLIESLRRWFRKVDVITELLDLNAVIAGVMPLVEADAKGVGVPVRVEFGTDVPRIMADAQQLQQVVLNLARNAIDAMRGHRSKDEGIVIRTETTPAGDARLLVVDHGRGVAKALGNAIFNPFVTTKRDNLGVGLAINRTIVEAHDGKLTYRANRGGGAVFEVTLPAMREGQLDG